jgi:DNA-binding transcriptional MocR family regulator
MVCMEWTLDGLTIERDGQAAIYQQLAEALAWRIGTGDLPPGTRLPSERDLARQLGISRTTAVSAYRELEARGLVRGHVGRGTYVCAGPVESGAPFAWRGKVALGAQRTVDGSLRTLAKHGSDRAVISLATGVGALDLFPIDNFRKLADRVLSRGAHAALGLGPTEGQPKLRRAIAARIGLSPEQVLIVNGAQQGLDLIARCLIDPGDTVIMDRPGYLGAIQVFRAAGANVIGWDIGRADPDELEDLLLRYRPKLLYTNPSFHNPTGRTLDLHERHNLLDLAVRYRLPVVEDDLYRDMWFGAPAPPSLRQLDGHQLVIQVNTFSKTLAGGVRLGWLAAAEPIIDQLALAKQRVDVASPSLEQLIVAEFLIERAYDEHLSTLRAAHRQRHDALLAAIRRHLPPGTLNVAPVDGGLYLWCPTGHDVNTRDLLADATEAGVVFVPGDVFYPASIDGSGRHEMRLCFSAVPPALIDEGIRRLAVAYDVARSRTGDRQAQAALV